MRDLLIRSLAEVVIEFGVAILILAIAAKLLFYFAGDRELAAKSGLEGMRWISAGAIAGAVAGFMIDYGRPWSTILAAIGISVQIFIELTLRRQEKKIERERSNLDISKEQSRLDRFQ